MSHPEPLVRAIPCPAQMLPSSAARLVKRAEARGLANRATLAIGYKTFGRAENEDYRPVRSVLVKVQSDRGRLAALWLGPVDGTKMSFDGAWIVRPGRYPDTWHWLPDRIKSGDLNAEVDAL